MNLKHSIFALIAVSFAISWIATLLMKRVAPMIGFVDKPGGRKIHANPKPLGGGVAIFLGYALPVLLGLAVIHFTEPRNLAAALTKGHEADLTAYWSGIRDRTPAALAIVVAAFFMHVLGLCDDRKALGPYFKLIVQLTVTAGLVLYVPELRAFSLPQLGFGPLISIAVTILWIGAITNAFNFLDNMDGLSAGVAAVCTGAFLVATLLIEQWFVAAALALLLGALLGFLCFNFSPATIFMGDSGSLLIGLLLGTLTVRTTNLRPHEILGAGWYSLFAPVIVLAVPLYDLIVVSAIRLGRGKSPFVGDTNHFSHRLVARGMSRRTAVLCLYLVSAATAVAAIILPYAPNTFVAILIFAQTLLILGVVMLLEQHPLPMPKETPARQTTQSVPTIAAEPSPLTSTSSVESYSGERAG
ncbi:MAG TPA: MraY family glycosyltransferase [Humisphaera sp.]|jgi:UDP-GlcNAc:undecaprenyl-phosphate GlcNAc-1-phosphate transferase|nr:MraY family glycosyltransferase [Humisphaera sp.]